jgi:hypothetical protein
MLPEARKAAGLLSTWYKLAALEVRTCRQVMPLLRSYTLTPLGAGLRLQAGWNIFFLFPRLGGLGGLGGAMGGKGVCHYTLTPLGPGLRL